MSKSRKRPDKEGRIVSFYSFKGGVGRTMALANVAFLAAINGKRVLVMDWDLEAPGLSYYFRGLVDAAEAKSIKSAPGVLDLLWDWVGSFKSSATEESLTALFESYQQGIPFKECVRSLLPDGLLPPPSALDFIGAGQLLQTASGKTYEDALSSFSWTHFFEQTAGGALIESLRNWAKENYDLVLIDSRTGLADVAGICTMQIPDAVIMCFVFNRQNIDGIARVSNAIRATRNNAIELRAVPMRTARQDTAEESDARARAVRELTKIGGFSSDIGEEFKSLHIPAAENVPFYETLAPLVAQDPQYDVLTLSYMRLATMVVGGEPLSLSYFSPEWVRTVRTRLQPRHATIEYLEKLALSEPSRAVEELHRLIEGAYEDELDGEEVDDKYAKSLITTAFDVADNAEEIQEGLGLRERALEFARGLYLKAPDQWRSVMTDSLERFWDTSSFLLSDEEQQLLVLSELDTVLSHDPSPAALLRRIQFKLTSARVLFPDYAVASQAIGEASILLKSAERVRSAYSPEQLEELFFADVDTTRIRGEIQSGSGDYGAALKSYRSALAKIGLIGEPTPQGTRLAHSLLSRISDALLKLDRVQEAAQASIEAARAGASSRAVTISNFATLAQPVIRSESPQLALEFTDATLLQRESGRLVSNYPPTFVGRQTSFGIQFLDAAKGIARLLAQAKGPTEPAVRALVESARNVAAAQLRRRQIIGKKDRVRLAEATSEFSRIVRSSWGDLNLDLELDSLAKALDPTITQSDASS